MRIYNFPSDEIHIKNNKGEELAKIGPDGVEIEGGSGSGVRALEEKVFFDGVATVQEAPPAPQEFPPLMILGDKPLDGSIKSIDVEFDGTHIVANRTFGEVGFFWISEDESTPVAFTNIPIYTSDEHILFSRTLEYSQGESIDVSEDFNNLVDNYDLKTVVVKINGQVAERGDLDTITFDVSNAGVTQSMKDNTMWSFQSKEAGEYTIEAIVLSTKQIFVATKKPSEIGESHSIKISYVAQDSKFAEGSTFVADSLGLIRVLYNKNINEEADQGAPKLAIESSSVV